MHQPMKTVQYKIIQEDIVLVAETLKTTQKDTTIIAHKTTALNQEIISKDVITMDKVASENLNVQVENLLVQDVLKDQTQKQNLY